MLKKKLISIDLDGVLNKYSGKYDSLIIPPPQDEAVEFIIKLSKYFKIDIFTTRKKNIS